MPHLTGYQLLVPQGSVFGPCLVVIYINDIDDSVSSKILTFSYAIITASISSVEERNILQTDLTRLMEWSEECRAALFTRLLDIVEYLLPRTSIFKILLVHVSSKF